MSTYTVIIFCDRNHMQTTRIICGMVIGFLWSQGQKFFFGMVMEIERVVCVHD